MSNITIVGIVAKYDTGRLHPQLAAVDATLPQVTTGDTVSITVPEGPFRWELGRLCDEDSECMLTFGTSANLTGQGQQFQIEDIESRVIDGVELVVNYGLQKWQVYRRSGVNFDDENMKVLRKGDGYEDFRDWMLRWFPHLLEEAGVSICKHRA